MRDFKYNYNSQTGMFRNKVLIQRQITETDSRKQQTSRFVDFGNYFGMIKTQKADEILANDQETTRITDRFVFKYSKRLDGLIKEQGTLIRLIHKGVIYDVKSAINDNELCETITMTVETDVGSDG